MQKTETHEWVKEESGLATIGITDHAQRELGEIVYVELPEVGQAAEKGETAVVLESTKAAIDHYFPVSGKVSAVNESLVENPGLINEAAESDGWLYKIEL